jgi:phosphoribosyl-AMP cyclohydrolase
VQTVHEIRLDCDNDVVLLKVTQLGTSPASPATRPSQLFLQPLREWPMTAVEPVLKDPETIYK